MRIRKFLIFLGLLLFFIALFIFLPSPTSEAPVFIPNATSKNQPSLIINQEKANNIDNNALEIAIFNENEKNNHKVIKTLKMWVTAYSSSPEETDDTPFITATLTEVQDGIIATNDLPFDTLIRIPEIFGDKIFIVKDRMHWSKEGIIDIWMPNKDKAINFGAHLTNIEIVEKES